jgi:hypothetical protein
MSTSRDPFTTPEPVTHPNYQSFDISRQPNEDDYFYSSASSVSDLGSPSHDTYYVPYTPLSLLFFAYIFRPTYSLPTRRCVWSTSFNIRSHTGILSLFLVPQHLYPVATPQTRLSAVHILFHQPQAQHRTSPRRLYPCHQHIVTSKLHSPTGGRRSTPLQVVAGASGSYVFFPSP